MPLEKRILIVDDEEDFTVPMELWLTNKGYGVRVATSGQAALDIIKGERPDMVFLDLVMPGMSGIETLKDIREIDKDLPVVVISAFLNPERIAQAETHGVVGTFSKEQPFESLIEVLDPKLF